MNCFVDIESAIDYMNDLGSRREAFVFLISYDQSEIIVSPEGEATFSYAFNGICGGSKIVHQPSNELSFEYYPLPYDDYLYGFNTVHRALKRGDSYLINLTHPTPILTNWSLADFFVATDAKYKVYLPDRFTCFSPETFVTIRDGVISSHPMKGTIDAAVDDAESLILSDEKEFAEHSTMVDLIRNDLSIVAKNVTVSKFRYLTKVNGHDKTLLQVSSQIDGQLPVNYKQRLGDILFSLLPAGSITGAPKEKTTQIISQAEQGNRGFYTGICGRFDGNNLDSGVMIRMITKDKQNMYYHSGGGITYKSNPRDEYEELIQKIYVPLSRDYKDRVWQDSKSELSQ